MIKAKLRFIKCRGHSPHHGFEILMRFKYLNLFKPNEHTEDCHIRKSNDKKFLLEIEDKKLFMSEKNSLLSKQRMK